MTKTKIFSRGPGNIVLAAILFTMIIPPAEAQHLTLQLTDPARRVINTSVYGDTDSNGLQPLPSFTAITNDPGVFYANSILSFSDSYLSVSTTALQNSTITATATSLTVTGRVEILCNSALYTAFASISWENESYATVGFVIDRPFTYSLQATTMFDTNFHEAAAIAMTGLSNEGYSSTGLPNLVAYGRLAIPSGNQTGPSSGTNTGVLSAGTYYFQARVHSKSFLDGDHPAEPEHFLASFNFTVTYVPQPPVIMAFTPNGAGAFNLTWNAPQAGNYRVLSSTNLTAWSELIPASAKPSGLNTNVVSAIPGSGQGFFRVEYLP